MERESWTELSEAIGQVERRWRDPARYTHRTATIVRVYLWAARHDRPVSWACDADNWEKRSRPDGALPDQSTMSRRTRTDAFERFNTAVGKRLAGRRRSRALAKKVDGKPLVVAAHSKDRDARWGRGAGQQSNGYKLHAIWSDCPMPEQWALTPLDVCEKRIARRMVKRLGGGGYLLADAYYDDSKLHDIAAAANHQLVAPRRASCRGKGLGHCYQSPHRLRCIDLTESPANVGNGFGTSLVRDERPQVERDLGNLCGFGGGLVCLPPWVRRIWRVRAWVHAKLLLNAARIHCRRRRVRA
jgi:hypothetical protein